MTSRVCGCHDDNGDRRDGKGTRAQAAQTASHPGPGDQAQPDRHPHTGAGVDPDLRRDADAAGQRRERGAAEYGDPAAAGRAGEAAGPEPARGRAVLDLAHRRAARQLRHLAGQRAAGGHPGRRADREFAGAGGPGRPDRHADRRGPRRARRRVAGQPVRPRAVGHLAGRHRAAGVRGGGGPSHLLRRGGRPLVPCRFCVRAGHSTVVEPERARAPGGDPCPGDRAVHLPDDAGVDDRRAGKRLRADGTPEGRAEVAGLALPRAAERHRADHPGHRAELPVPGRRGGGRGVHVQLPRARPRAGIGGLRPGHPADPGHRAGPGGLLHLRQHRHRHHIARREPAAAAAEILTAEGKVPMARRSEALAVIGRAVRTPQGATGLAIAGCVVLVAAIGPAVAPYSSTQFVTAPFARASSVAWLGGDILGRDVLSRTLDGGWELLAMAAVATALGVAVGAALGVMAAYYGGFWDNVIMRAVDVILAFPQLVFALLLVAILGPKIWLIVLAVAISHAPQVARVTRSAALDISERDFVKAMQILGIPGRRIIRKDVLPNLTSVLMVEIGLRLTYSMLVIAGLSFLGFGLQPPAASWGLMINENRVGLISNPWGVLMPAILIALFTIGVNTFTDAVARASLGVGGRATEPEPVALVAREVT